MQKAKRRSPVVTVYVTLNGNGHSNGHKASSWMPGDPIENHPLADLIGSHANDPYWDEFVQIMADNRQKQLERDLKNLEDAE